MPVPAKSFLLLILARSFFGLVLARSVLTLFLLHFPVLLLLGNLLGVLKPVLLHLLLVVCAFLVAHLHIRLLVLS